jgi:hypothetical protein
MLFMVARANPGRHGSRPVTSRSGRGLGHQRPKPTPARPIGGGGVVSYNSAYSPLPLFFFTSSLLLSSSSSQKLPCSRVGPWREKKGL